MKHAFLAICVYVALLLPANGSITSKFEDLGIDHPIQVKPTCLAHTFSQLLSFTLQENISVIPWETAYETLSEQERVLQTSGGNVEGFLPYLWSKHPNVIVEFPPDTLPLWGRSYKDYLRNLILVVRIARSVDNGNLAWARLKVLAGYPVAMTWVRKDWSPFDAHSLLLVDYNLETKVYQFRNWWEDSKSFELPAHEVEGYMMANYTMSLGEQNIPALTSIYDSCLSRMVIFQHTP